MVNNGALTRPGAFGRVGVGVYVYVAVAAATIVVLAVLSATGSRAATPEAWVHAIIVGVFALVLPLRWRAAARGSAGALRAVGVIAAVLLVANVVEAALPGLFPSWMRVEMVAIAVLMAVLVGTVVSAVHAVRVDRARR